MRNLFLLLVLVNLGALAVFAWVLETPSPPPAYDGPGITLLRELDPDTPISRSVAESDTTSRLLQSPPVADPAVAADESPDDASAPIGGEAVVDEAARIGDSSGQFLGECISIGPFADLAEATAASITLIDAGFDPSRATREDEVWDGYWVYIEEIENFTAAQEIQIELAENGLDDTQIIANSDGGNLLSIGVFSDITRAAAQAERVDQAGYQATIADNSATRETHWLDVILTDEQSIGLETLQAPGRISRLEILECAGEGTD